MVTRSKNKSRKDKNDLKDSKDKSKKSEKDKKENKKEEIEKKIQEMEIEQVSMSEKIETAEKQFFNSQEEVQNLKRKLDRKKKSLQKISEEIKNSNEEKRSLQSENAKLSEKVQEQSKNLEKVKSELFLLNDEQRLWRNKNISLENELKILSDSAANWTRSNLESEEKNKNLIVKLKASETRFEEAEASLLASTKKVALLQGQVDDLENETLRVKLEGSKNENCLKSRVQSLEIEVASKNEQLVAFSEENKNYKTKLSSQSAEFTERTNQTNEKYEQLAMRSELKDKEMDLLKKAGDNYENHINSLKNELVQTEAEIATLSARLDEKETRKSVEEDNLKALLQSEKASSYLSSSFREMAVYFNPNYNASGEMKFEASPDMPSNELYLKFVHAYDCYRAAFREKLALEDGLRRYSSYIEKRSPEVNKLKTQFEMLKRSYGNVTKKLSEARHKIITQTALFNQMKATLSTISAKKTAYKKTVNLLKEQVQAILFGKNSKIDSEFVFKDMKDLHDKYVKILKKVNEMKSTLNEEKVKTEEDNDRLHKDFSKMRESYHKSLQTYQNDFKILTEKYDKMKQSNASTSTPGEEKEFQRKRKFADMEENKNLQKIFDDLNNSLKSMREEKVKCVSEAENKIRTVEKELYSLKLEKTRAENELKHEKKMKEIIEKDVERLSKDTKRMRESIAKHETTISHLEENISTLNTLFDNEKQQKQTLSAKLEYLKGNLNALEKSEKRAIEKIEESNEMISMLKAKIERLEETNKILSEAERSKVEKLLEEKQELELEWRDLRQAREIDLKCGREALESSNSLAKKALDELRIERIENTSTKAAIKELQVEISSLQKNMAEKDEELLSLRKHKQIIEKAGLIVSGAESDAGLSETEKNAVLSVTSTQIVNYEREIEEINLQKKSLEAMYQSSSALIHKLEEKLEIQKAESLSKINELTAENENICTRMYKIANLYQKTIYENGKLSEANQQVRSELEALKELHEKEFEEKEKSFKEFEEKSERLMRCCEVEKARNSDLSKEYESEVERHGKTIEKMKSFENLYSKSNSELKSLQTSTAETHKRISDMETALSDQKISHEFEISDLRQTITESKEKFEILSSELDSTNSLNRYLRRKLELTTHDSSRFPQEETAIEIDPEKQSDAQISPESLDKDKLENYKLLLEEARKNRDLFERQLEKFKVRLQNSDAEREIKEVQVKALKEELDKAIADISEISKSSKEFEEFEKTGHQLIILTENNKSLRKKNSKLVEKKQRLSKQVADLNRSIEPLNSKIEEFEAENSELKLKLEASTNLAKSWENRCRKIFDKDNFIDAEEHNALKESLRKLKMSIEKEKEEIEQKSISLKNQIKNLEEEKSKLQGDLQKADESIKKFEGQDFGSVLDERNALKEKQSEFFRERLLFNKEKNVLVQKEKKSSEGAKEMKEVIDTMVREVEKHKLLCRKLELLLKEEKETSNIYKRNAQTANARCNEKQAELQEMSQRMSSFGSLFGVGDAEKAYSYPEKFASETFEKEKSGSASKAYDASETAFFLKDREKVSNAPKDEETENMGEEAKPREIPGDRFGRHDDQTRTAEHENEDNEDNEDDSDQKEDFDDGKAPDEAKSNAEEKEINAPVDPKEAPFSAESAGRLAGDAVSGANSIVLGENAEKDTLRKNEGEANPLGFLPKMRFDGSEPARNIFKKTIKLPDFPLQSFLRPAGQKTFAFPEGSADESKGDAESSPESKLKRKADDTVEPKKTVGLWEGMKTRENLVEESSREIPETRSKNDENGRKKEKQTFSGLEKAPSPRKKLKMKKLPTLQVERQGRTFDENPSGNEEDSHNFFSDYTGTNFPSTPKNSAGAMSYNFGDGFKFGSTFPGWLTEEESRDKAGASENTVASFWEQAWAESKERDREAASAENKAVVGSEEGTENNAIVIDDYSEYVNETDEIISENVVKSRTVMSGNRIVERHIGVRPLNKEDLLRIKFPPDEPEEDEESDFGDKENSSDESK